MKIKKKTKKPLYYHSILNNIKFLMSAFLRDKKILFLLIFIECLLGVFTPLFGIYLPKFAVDLVVYKTGIERVLFILGGFTICMILTDAIYNMTSRAKYMHYNSMRQYYLLKIFYKFLDCDYKQIESSYGQTRHTRAMGTLSRGDASGTSRMVVAMVAIFISTLNFLLYSTIISILNPLIIVFLFALTSINYFSMKYARKYAESRRIEQSDYDKKLGYIENKSSDIEAGKDIRLFNMANWFLTLHNTLMKKYYEITKQIRQHYYLSAVVNIITSILRDGLTYIYLIIMVTNGNITVGDFMLYFGAVAGFSGFINSIVYNYNELNTANTEMNYMREFLEFSDDPEPETPMAIPEMDDILSISFKHIYFSYDKENGYVLEDFNLDISAGEKIALVGVNGAGKTTIVKLLCGFYTPDSGEILINGINITNFRKKDLYKLFSAVFQDIMILPFTIAENVSLKIDSKTDKTRVNECLEKAGLYKDIMKYEKGIESNMEKIHDDGVVLSGGQQQKLLMARALYKDAPLLILDEPTAALDPIAESETYEKFHELSRNKTSIYISHRLASTRFCDRIAFLKNGKIIENGSHNELMKLNGEYANMFEIQSHYYKDSKEVGVVYEK